MKIDRQALLDEKYSALCDQIAAHRLPRWEMLPDIELYMDQVIAVMERFLSLYHTGEEENRLVTPSIINNYVKLKVIPAPVKKRYGREHLAYLLMICILKQTLAISTVVTLLEQQRREKSVEALYNEFCGIYEQVVSLARQTDTACDEPLRQATTPGMPLFYAAIVAVVGRFLCEGTLSALTEQKGEKKAEKEKKSEKEKKPDKEKKAEKAEPKK